MGFATSPVETTVAAFEKTQDKGGIPSLRNYASTQTKIPTLDDFQDFQGLNLIPTEKLNLEQIKIANLAIDGKGLRFRIVEIMQNYQRKDLLCKWLQRELDLSEKATYFKFGIPIPHVGEKILEVRIDRNNDKPLFQCLEKTEWQQEPLLMPKKFLQ